MTEQPRKSKKTIKVLIGVLAFLFIALIGAVVYFYLLSDTFQTEEDDEISCGCYYIDPQVVSSCGDTKRGFLFNTSKGTMQDCKASCPLTELDVNLLYSTTERDSYITCNVRTIPDVRCESMIVKTTDGKIVTGKVTPDEEILITALFDSSEYTDYTFLINNVPTQPSQIDGRSMELTITELEDITTLTIVAQAKDKRGDLVESIMCNRIIEISTTAKAGVSSAAFETYTNSENRTQIRSVLVLVGGLKETEDTKLEFSFSNKLPSITMINGFEVDPSRGRVFANESALYNPENFAGENSFSALANATGEIEITTKVSQDSVSLGSVISTVLFKAQDIDGKEPDITPPTTPSTPPDREDADVPDGTVVEESSFEVTKSGTPLCVERVSPDNVAEFSIVISNKKASSDSIQEVKDKLPLGFTYVSGSTRINSLAVADSVFVTVNNVGSSQEIIWKPQTVWNIDGSSNMTISFKADAGSSALTGKNLNEVIITPSEIPVDPSTLRSSFEIIVAQDCDDIPDSIPQTGIFDSTIGKIFVGLLIIGMGVILYNGNQGSRLARMILHSDTYKGAEMTSFKIFKPKRYFEEKILERIKSKR